MFDPTEDYLTPPLQGFRLVDGEYLPIEPVDGRLPSEVLGLHLEQDGRELRLYDPARRLRLLKPVERTILAEAIARDRLAQRTSGYAGKSKSFAAERAQVNEAVSVWRKASHSSAGLRPFLVAMYAAQLPSPGLGRNTNGGFLSRTRTPATPAIGGSVVRPVPPRPRLTEPLKVVLRAMVPMSCSDWASPAGDSE